MRKPPRIRATLVRRRRQCGGGGGGCSSASLVPEINKLTFLPAEDIVALGGSEGYGC